MSIYTEMKDARLKMDNHYSDLYVEDSLKAREILAEHKSVCWSRFFNCDGKLWIDVPFMHDPFWDEVERKKVARGL